MKRTLAPLPLDECDPKRGNKHNILPDSTLRECYIRRPHSYEVIISDGSGQSKDTLHFPNHSNFPFDMIF